jgi:hypothetical protein
MKSSNKSEDALDRPRGRQKLGKAERQKFAKQKFVEELVVPSTKHQRPAWMEDPTLLPKKPPVRKSEDQ